MVKFSLEDLLKVAARILSRVKQEVKDINLESDVQKAIEKVNKVVDLKPKDPSLEKLIEYESTLKEILESSIDFNNVSSYYGSKSKKEDNPDSKP
ncbi:hypothetical protein [Nostoc sp.]|uniref:hypothetical protein n=1 Tax=Nostoc sp. TaxID=1180 RepID=UPI002FFCBA04